jgi:hypothetical protein
VIYTGEVRVCVALFVLVAACGRIGFDATGTQSATIDSADPTGGNPGPTLDGALDDGAGSPDDGATAACTRPDIGCAANEYCGTPLGMCNASGTCQAVPRPNAICPDVIVCGCDGKQYVTPCAAARAHQSVLSLGSCPI